MQIEPVTLTGRHVRLEPLQRTHAAALLPIIDEEVWQWLPNDMPRSVADVEVMLDDLLRLQAQGVDLPFVIIDVATDAVIGSTRLLDLSVKYRHAEIGGTWLARTHWRSAANTEAKFLLLSHAFETWGCIRVQLKTDLRNERSQAAIARLGAVREGVLRKAVIVKGDYHRSSVYFSVIDDEWPDVKRNLEEKLGLTKA